MCFLEIITIELGYRPWDIAFKVVIFQIKAINWEEYMFVWD
jgi:hypothetical protein